MLPSFAEYFLKNYTDKTLWMYIYTASALQWRECATMAKRSGGYSCIFAEPWNLWSLWLYPLLCIHGKGQGIIYLFFPKCFYVISIHGSILFWVYPRLNKKYLSQPQNKVYKFCNFILPQLFRRYCSITTTFCRCSLCLYLSISNWTTYYLCKCILVHWVIFKSIKFGNTVRLSQCQHSAYAVKSNTWTLTEVNKIISGCHTALENMSHFFLTRHFGTEQISGSSATVGKVISRVI